MMRKSVFLTLLVALFSVATAWAEFNPDPNKLYSLKVKDTNPALYLDVLTGVDNPNDEGEQRNISLSSSPCGVYLEKNDQWTYFMKNTKGEYIHGL